MRLEKIKFNPILLLLFLISLLNLSFFCSKYFKSFFCCQSHDIKYSFYVIWFDQIYFKFPIYRPINCIIKISIQTNNTDLSATWKENKKLVLFKLFERVEKISSASTVYKKKRRGKEAKTTSVTVLLYQRNSEVR